MEGSGLTCRQVGKEGKSDTCHGAVDFPRPSLHHLTPHSVQNEQCDPHLGEEESAPLRD